MVPNLVPRALAVEDMRLHFAVLDHTNVDELFQK